MAKQTRRRFLLDTGKAGIFSVAAASLPAVLASCGSSRFATGIFKTGYDQQPLPYKYDALEDAVDWATMEIHYTKHAAAYSKNLKEAALAENADTRKPLEEVLARISKYSAKMRNNGGGHYNHEMFWQCMRPKSADNKPTGRLLTTIENTFGSFAGFKTRFADEAKNRFGSGWAWLYLDKNKILQTGSTPNQDNPLMDISDIKGFPLLALDVWEHAYYLRYQNKRADYIDNWWSVVNWDYIQKRFDAAV
ncbi:MAG TPA: superoxide dismutase [Ferruginibacter sp.]|mgnify:CR=1 FL=1|nr:superoxide dismutase [Ferruginibacter sp.]HMP21476.1 superoxide dismutase [Ferruginibacter sp.]